MERNHKYQILDFLKDVSYSIEELLDIGLSQYSELLRKRANYFNVSATKKSNLQKINNKKGIKRKKSLYMLLYRLKKDGLILIDKQSNKFRITDLGKNILEKLKLKSKLSLPIVSNYNKEKESDKLLKIIIFDIPEKEKRKREWLRGVLKRLGFNMLQKSVWAGKFSLPEKFIRDLKKLNLLPHVEIFVISRSGSLKHVV